MKKTARSLKGFTLVELLVVIAIVAILAAIVILVINPLEMTKRSRDAARLADLASLQQAINVAFSEATGTGRAVLCYDPANPDDGLPDALCTGNSADTGARASDGTGWVKVKFSSKTVSVPVLPADPTNSGVYVYTYKADGNAWEINAVLESEQQSPKMATDGGPASDDDVYEVGSDPGLDLL